MPLSETGQARKVCVAVGKLGLGGSNSSVDFNLYHQFESLSPSNEVDLKFHLQLTFTVDVEECWILHEYIWYEMIWYEKWYFNLWPIMVHYSTFCRVCWYLFSQNRLNSKYRVVITSVNFLFHFFNNWSMLSAKLWANSVYSSLKIRFSHRDPDVPLENLEPLEPFQTHRSAQNLPEDISDEAMSIVKNILEPSLKGHVVRPHCQVHPRYDSSATSHMGKVIFAVVRIFCHLLSISLARRETS